MQAGDFSQHFGQGIDLAVIQAQVHAVQGQQGQHHIFIGCVAGPLAHGTDGSMGHIRAGGQAHDGVGGAQAVVVMEMQLDRLARDASLHGLDQIGDGVGGQHAHGVHNGQGVHVAVVGHVLQEIQRPLHGGPGHVDREEYRVEPGFLGGQRGLDGQL